MNKVEEKRKEVEIKLLESIAESQGGYRKDCVAHYASFAHSLYELRLNENKGENK